MATPTPSLTTGFTSGKSKLPARPPIHVRGLALTHLAHSLQLNIGIVAACASFLKPLVGRLLKINSTIGYSYPSNQYHRSGRTPMGVETIGSGYPAHKRRGGANRTPMDEFELHTKNDLEGDSGDDPHHPHHHHHHQHHHPQVITRVQGARSRSRAATSQDNSSAEAVDAPQSDTNSEEIILQKQQEPPGRGIVLTRDVSVHYSNK